MLAETAASVASCCAENAVWQTVLGDHTVIHESYAAGGNVTIMSEDDHRGVLFSLRPNDVQ